MEKVSVVLDQGTLIGYKDVLPNGCNYFIFKGIPYAKPPIGHLRFKPPEPLDAYSKDVLDCTSERDVSVQRNIFNGLSSGVESDKEFVGSESCLYLNIYTPQMKKKLIKKLPVMIWIHGGLYMMGSGNSQLFSPEYLVQEEAVIVTINYRLGPLGFLCLPNAGIHGNSGLKDQLAAFKWINKNIGEFNGDPGNVTLFGQSSGSTSIHFHIFANNSRQYFHKAICQSGTSNMAWALLDNIEMKTRRLAEILGCKNLNDDREILKFLENVPANDLIKNAHKTLSNEEKRKGLPISFAPVVELDTEKAIVTRKFVDIMNENTDIEGYDFDIPIIFSRASHEGIYLLDDAMTRLEEFNNDDNRIVPKSIKLPKRNKKKLQKHLADNIKKFYFGTKANNIGENSINEFINFLTDYYFTIDWYNAVRFHIKHQKKSPIFLMRFSYNGDINLHKKLFQLLTNINGACHSDDVFYLFSSKILDLDAPVNSDAGQIRYKMCKMWTNFAKFSNPTPSIPENNLKIKWLPTNVKNSRERKRIHFNYLNLDNNIKMLYNLDNERIEFWLNVYSQYNNNWFTLSKL